MLRFFRSRARQEQAKAAIPDGERVYAIGDVHGRLDLLEDLLQKIEADDASRPPASVTLIFLGDLIDRGPESAGVIERLKDLARTSPRATMRFLLGNHEEVLLTALAGDTEALRLCHRIGGRETLLSYGVSEEEYHQLPTEELLNRAIELIPQEHVDFLRTFEALIIIGDYAFVHAGVRPGRALANQKPKDLRWIRGEFLQHQAGFEKMVVHGHSITHEVEMRPNRIGVDTGAYASGKLTALGLEGEDHWVLQTLPSPDGGSDLYRK